MSPNLKDDWLDDIAHGLSNGAPADQVGYGTFLWLKIMAPDHLTADYFSLLLNNLKIPVFLN